jgi:hypothetical protein
MWTLQAIRRIRSMHRRIFGKRAPHWVEDGFKYVNFLRLLPTVHMIICKPAHFFKSVPAILNGKKSYYLSPLQFVTNLAALQILIVPLIFSGSPSKEAMAAWNIGAVVLSPALIVCACALVLVLWHICANMWPLRAVANELPFNYHGALIPLSPSTYANLEWGRYFWSLFYYYLYFYFMLLVGMGSVALAVGVWKIYTSVTVNIHINRVTIIPFAVIGLIAAIAGYWLFVRPYILLLMASSRAPTERMRLYLASENPRLSNW